MGVEDVLAYQDEHFAVAPARAKLLYLESIKKPQLLLHHARSLRAKGCQIIALKAGASDIGARAATSHTGAMASRDDAVSALLQKAGIVRVHSRREMVNVAGLLSSFPLPKGREVVVVTQAGGPAILLADALSGYGFNLPLLSPRTQERLQAALAPGASTKNPVDFLASGTAQELRMILSILDEEERERMDGICVIFGSPGLFNIWPVYQVVIEAQQRLALPLYPIFPSVRTAAREAEQFRASGHFYFTDEVDLAQALGRWQKSQRPGASEAFLTPPLVKSLGLQRQTIAYILESAQRHGLHQLPAEQVKQVLQAAGFILPEAAIVTHVDDALQKAHELGYPVALKIVGPLHKSDVQGVQLNLRCEQEVREGFSRLMAIPGALGIEVQQQVSGLELLLGASREGRFGHLLLFGLGGIHVETMADVAMALSPLTLPEIAGMLSGFKGAPLLNGQRGRQGIEHSALVDALLRLSQLVEDFPQIEEIEINPLIGAGPHLWAVDARLSLGSP
jgi:acetyltransferase